MYCGEIETQENYFNQKPYVLVFDWELNLRNAFQLDKSVFKLTIDEEQSKLFGLVPTKEGFTTVYSFKY